MNSVFDGLVFRRQWKQTLNILERKDYLVSSRALSAVLSQRSLMISVLSPPSTLVPHVTMIPKSHQAARQRTGVRGKLCFRVHPQHFLKQHRILRRL
mmetsp:Transcript_65309/g.139769  ORF Transcript_65309/g.139769 Transcript_65309/m.139769 type:complete len:97 (+) Transcript_65309:144-434(+)